MKGLSKLLPKVTGKAGREIAESAGKAVAGSGDNVLSKLRVLWKGADEAVEMGAKSSDTGAKELLESILHKDFSAGFSREVKQTINKLHSSLSNVEAEAQAVINSSGNIKKLENALNDPEKLAKIINQDGGRSLGIRIPENVMGAGPESIISFIENNIALFRSNFRRTVANVKQAEAQLHYIQRAKFVLNEPNGEMKLIRMLNEDRKLGGGFFGSGLEAKIPDLRNLLDKMNEVQQFGARHLNDTKFVQKALTLSKNDPDGFKLFLAHPDNYPRWIKLQKSPGYVGELIEKGSPRISRKRSLIGITPMETLKRLGLGVGTLGLGYTAVKVYNWFGNNDPAETAQKSISVEAQLANLRTRGEGAQVVRVVQSALTNITNASNKVNSGLSKENAAESVKMFVGTISKELERLGWALEQWDVVGANSEDQRNAQAVGVALGQLSNNIAEGINKLGGRVVVSKPGIASKDKMRSVDSGNLSKIQGFLGINQSGQLDQTTVKMLRQLETEYQRRSDDDGWLGAFIVPDTGKVISYDDLLKSQQIINKY